ncbi:MAG: YdeI/OmpD-associated family protein [Solirubrobacteraceae bacterium]
MTDALRELIVADAAAWRNWLSTHSEDHAGVWLTLAKKGTIEPTRLTYEQALEEALCHGWIDGQVRRRDELTYRQRFTPRRERSRWSKRNVEIAGRLLADGRVRPGGLAAMQRAQADGHWEGAYPGQAGSDVPADPAASTDELPGMP